MVYSLSASTNRMPSAGFVTVAALLGFFPSRPVLQWHSTNLPCPAHTSCFICAPTCSDWFTAHMYSNHLVRSWLQGMAASAVASSGWKRGKVKAVPSGDTLLIMDSVPGDAVPPEKSLTLSGIIATRLVRSHVHPHIQISHVWCPNTDLMIALGTSLWNRRAICLGK